jgi:hypothetical protein
MKLKTIPPSVLTLLAVADRSHDAGRQVRYIHRPEDKSPRNGLTWSEVRALIDDDMIANDWVGGGAAIAVTEHEQRVVCDFCSDVYEAPARVGVPCRRSGARLIPADFRAGKGQIQWHKQW